MVFWAPVAGDLDMLEIWSRPANELGLRILGGAYEKPTIVQGHYLEGLRQETDALESWLIANVPDDSFRQTTIGHRRFEVPLLVDLINRLQDVGAAIGLAQALKGTLTIS
jgi:hypothetical protein